MKKIIAFLLSLALLTTLTIPVFAVSSVTATTMRLEKTQGTVTLTNQNGRKLPLLENSKLYNGYTMDTKKASYAYINLDDTKANKLDAFSKAGVRKKGQNLEFFLYYGNMFFHVKKPLAQGQTYDIRTANFVTGIRGTAGYVAVIDENTSSLFLLEGEVSLTHTDPVTGETKPMKVKAGQAALSSRLPNQNGRQITLQEMNKEQLPGFVLEEIAKDPDLRKKIEEQTGWDLTEQIKNWEEILKNDQQTAEKKQQAADNASKVPYVNPQIDALFPNSDPPSGGTSHSGKDSENPRETTLTNATASQINEALASYSTVRLRGTSGTMDAPITVPTGKTLRLDTGSMTMGADAPLTINGTTVIASGAELINDTTAGDGLRILSPNSLEIAGTVTNRGLLRVGGENEGRIAILPGGRLHNASGGELRNEWGEIENQGVLEIQGEVTNMDRLTNRGSITVQTGGALRNRRGDTGSGYLLNTGSLSIEPDAELTNFTVLETSQTLSNSGTITLSTSGIVRLKENLSDFATNSGRMQDENGSTATLQYVLENGNRAGFLSIGALLDFAPADQPVTYTLTDYLYLMNQEVLSIPENTLVTLDLAGHSLVVRDGSSIQNSGSLTIQDSKSGGTLALEGEPLQNNGTLTLQGGTISGAKGAVKNKDKGALAIASGMVEATEAGYYAVEGPFTCTEEGLVRAKTAADLCTEPPAGWKHSDGPDTDGWYTLQKS